jgi:hypothetical protein
MGGQMPVPHDADEDFTSLIGQEVGWKIPVDDKDNGRRYGSSAGPFIAVPDVVGKARKDRAFCSAVVQQATPTDCAILLGVPRFDDAYIVVAREDDDDSLPGLEVGEDDTENPGG